MSEWLLNLLEFLSLLTFLFGIGLIYVPAALIIGGALGVLAFEYLDRRMKVARAKQLGAQR